MTYNFREHWNEWERDWCEMMLANGTPLSVLADIVYGCSPQKLRYWLDKGKEPVEITPAHLLSSSWILPASTLSH